MTGFRTFFEAVVQYFSHYTTGAKGHNSNVFRQTTADIAVLQIPTVINKVNSQI